MKITRLAILISLLFQFYLLQAQNLVPNPSFEEYDTCPNFYEQINYAIGWHGFSADYYNSCDTNSLNFGVPSNGLGIQSAASGNAYGGINTYLTSNSYREFVQIELVNPLTIGERYYVILKVCLADYSNCVSNNFGILFSTDLFNYGKSAPIYNNAQAYSNSVIDDSISWTIVAGSFVADSAYQYLAIGNFFDTTFTSHNCVFGSSYYFFDDICVSTDSLECTLITGRTDILQVNEIIVYPNPATQTIMIQADNVQSSIKALSIYDITGRAIYGSTSLTMTHATVDVSNLPNGLYFLHVEMSNGERFVRKVMKE